MISHEFYIAANKPKKQSKKEENSKYSELQINKNQKKILWIAKNKKKIFVHFRNQTNQNKNKKGK